MDKGEAVKLLKGGIEMSDRVVTVAPSYCQVGYMFVGYMFVGYMFVGYMFVGFMVTISSFLLRV